MKRLCFCRSKKNLDKSRIEADEKAVLNVVKTVKLMVYPFENEQADLVHLASGTVPTPAVADDMKTMLEKGKSASISFMKTNIIREDPNIYSTIKTNLKAFSYLGKKVTSKSTKGKLVAMKNSKILFAKMLLIAKSRNLNIKDVLKYSLRPFPSSLATLEGDLIKTQKSKLLQAVENEADSPTVTGLPDGYNACVLDAFAILQTLTPVPDSFGELSKQLLGKVVNSALSSKCKTVDFVCHRYPQQSIKSLKRNRRSAQDVQKIKIYSMAQKVPRQWKKFLSFGENKEELMKFIYSSWIKADPTLLKDIEVYLAHEEMCHKFIASSGLLTCQVVDELTCDYEEADTRMLTHACHASQLCNNMVIKSPDTDVFFIALNASLEINANLFFETGVGNGRRIISLNLIKQCIGYHWCSALIGLHAFTGLNLTVNLF